MNKIVDKKASIAIVCDDFKRLSEIELGLTQAGYKYLKSYESYSQLVAKGLPINLDWIVGSIMPDHDFTGIHLLKMLASNIALRKIRVSFFLEMSHMPLVPLAFEHGLLSWHPNQFSRAAINSFALEVVNNLKEFSGNDVKVAAKYLRNYLKDNAFHKSRIFLEEKLIDQFPGEPILLIDLANANLDIGQIETAHTIINQAVFLDDRLEKKSSQLLQEIRDRRKSSSKEARTESQGFFGIKSCFVIDPDEAVAYYVETMLNELGVDKVSSFHNGLDAWQAIQQRGEPDLILQEWRIPKLSGVAFIQRLRSEGFNKAIVVLMSSLVKKEDAPLLNEMSIASLISKPFTKKDFFLSLRWTLTQNVFPTEQRMLEKKISLALNQPDLKEAHRLKIVYMADRKISEGRKSLVQAKFLFVEKKYQAAKEKVIESIHRTSTEPLEAINLLGKCLLKLEENKGALKCFEKAQSISPFHIERLCNIAELQLAVSESDKAKKTIEQLSELDSDSKLVLLTSAKVAASTDDVKKAKKLMEQVGSKLEFVRYMNNRAVAISKAGNVEEGYDLYRRALASLPVRETDLKSILNYNLGLAFVRGNRISDAAGALKLAIELRSSTVLEKSHSLLSRVNIALATGEPVRLRGTSSEETDADELSELEFETLIPMAAPSPEEIDPLAEVARPGDMCLLNIFKFQDEDHNSVKAMRLRLEAAIKKTA